MKFKLTLIIFFIVQIVCSQQVSISGYVIDANSGERIIGAYVLDKVSGIVTSTNNYGFFCLKLPNNTVSIQATYVGSLSQAYNLEFKQDTLFEITINTVNEISEVVIESQSVYQNKCTPLGLSVIPVKSLTLSPVIGEPDLIKAIQIQPGIKGGIEGSTGIFVRGGGSGENLFMLDDVPIYNVSHLYGFFSAFNNQAVKDIKLIKGCFSAKYGGRTSSIVDVRSLDGNNQKIMGTISIGLISSQFTLQGPLLSKKTTFLLSARRSYFDLVAKPLKSMGSLNSAFPDYNFYDLNLKLSHTFSEKDKLFINIYNGKDNIQNTDVFEENLGTVESFSEMKKETSGWGNAIASLRYNHVFHSNLFINTTLAYSIYNYFSNNKYHSVNEVLTNGIKTERTYLATYLSEISDIIAKTDFDYLFSDKQTFRFGFGDTYHIFNPGEKNYHFVDEELNTIVDTSFVNNLVFAHESFIYIEDNMDVTPKIKAIIGTRMTGMSWENNFDWNIEPRISANYLLTKNSVIKAGYSRMNQYMHLLSSSGITLPTDIWVPALKGVKPLQSDQLNVGFTYQNEDKWIFNFEVYQKWMKNTVELRNGASVATDFIPWYDKITQGSGKAKGIELLAQKQQGKLKGLISYTLSSADRQFKDLNNGKNFPFKYDRLHDLSVSLSWQINLKWDFSALWVLGSGYPVTLFTDKYLAGINMYNTISEIGDVVYNYPSKNNYRLPAYHRLDVGIHYKSNNRLGENFWSFDVYNLYNRKNPVYIYYSSNYPPSFKYGSFLPIIPSISYTLKF